MDIPAASTVPSRQKINTINALMKIPQPEGQEFAVFTYLLNKDIVGPDGKIDNLYGAVFHMGSFCSYERASQRARQVIAMTGCDDVIVAKLGLPARLTLVPDSKIVTEVPVDLKGKLIEMQNRNQERRDREHEERIKIQEEIMADKEAEQDPTNPEYFRHQCFLAIRNRANYLFHQKQMEASLAAYQMRKSKIKEFYSRNEGPEVESNWLVHLEEKLKRRGEESIFEMMKSAYEEIRGELLGTENTQDNSEEIKIVQDPTSEKSHEESDDQKLDSQEKSNSSQESSSNQEEESSDSNQENSNKVTDVPNKELENDDHVFDDELFQEE